MFENDNQNNIETNSIPSLFAVPGHGTPVSEPVEVGLQREVVVGRGHIIGEQHPVGHLMGHCGGVKKAKKAGGGGGGGMLRELGGGVGMAGIGMVVVVVVVRGGGGLRSNPLLRKPVSEGERISWLMTTCTKKKCGVKAKGRPIRTG